MRSGRRSVLSINWDRLAPYYDGQLWLERSALRCAVELAEVRDADRVLDLGTGTGALLRVLAERSRPEEVVGIDVSRRMLAGAPVLPAGWRLMRADVRALPFEDGRFQIATAAYLLHLLDRQSSVAALSEIRRVLVPGGRVVTVTPSEYRTGLGFPWAVTATGLRRLAPSVFGGLRPFDPRADLESTGFAVESRRYSVWGYPSLCVRAVAG